MEVQLRSFSTAGLDERDRPSPGPSGFIRSKDPPELTD